MKKTKKIYFCAYECVYSFNFLDAVLMVEKQIKGTAKDFIQEGGKELKRKLAKHKYELNHYHCLDFGKEEWEDCLKDIIEEIRLSKTIKMEDIK